MPVAAVEQHLHGSTPYEKDQSHES
jgi:hypothetical protein